METYIVITVIAIVYALIRSGHDASINNGIWKKWATLELLFIAGAFVGVIGDGLIDYIMLPMIFLLWWSIFFDSACGLWRVKKLFYFGIGEWDQKMKGITHSPVLLFVWKVVVLTIISGAWFSFKSEF